MELAQGHFPPPACSQWGSGCHTKPAPVQTRTEQQSGGTRVHCGLAQGALSAAWGQGAIAANLLHP